MVRLNVQGAGLFLRPAADALATASDVPLDLPEAIAFLTGMLCYVLYTTHFNGNGKYPLECDVALPLPYPARSVPYLRALLQQRTDPASSQALLDGQPNAPRAPTAGQTGRGLASLELRSAYGGSDAVDASTFDSYDRSSDYGTSSSSLEVVRAPARRCFKLVNGAAATERALVARCAVLRNAGRKACGR